MSNITLRDHFAGMAMQGLLSNQGLMTTYDGNYCSIIARDAYEVADAMIAERNKHHKERHETFGEEV